MRNGAYPSLTNCLHEADKGARGMTTEVSVLPNGVRVASRTLPHCSATAVGVWLHNGSRHQAARQSGYAHFLEHLFFKGTRELDVMQLAQHFERMGGQINAHTGKELTALHGLVPNEDAPTLLQTLAAMLLDPRFSQHDVEIEREVVLQEMAMVRDQPEERLEEDLVAQIWPRQAMGWPILGAEEIVAKLNRDDLRAYLQSLLCGRRLLVVAVGGAAHAAIVDACTPLAALPPGVAPKVSAPTFQREHIERAYGVAQACFSWAMPAPPLTDASYPAHIIANHILGGGATSRLFQEVREQRGLVYGISSQLESHSDCGLWSIQTACEPEHADECRSAVEESVERLLATGPSAEELDITRKFARASVALEQHNLESAMERTARELVYFGRPISLEEHLQKLAAVHADEVRDSLQRAWAQRAFGMTAPDGSS